MKCPKCNASTKVLETREPQEFIVMRRHRCENGHISKTYQIPDAVFRRQKTYIMHAYDGAMRGVKANRAMHKRHQAIREMLQQGVKWIAIAQELNVSENTIRSVKKRMTTVGK